MGNKMNLELKEGNHSIEIKETLIRDFQDRIYTMDKSMASFVNAIDSTESACEILLRQIDKPENKDKDMKPIESHSECKLDDKKLAAKLLEHIKDCVSDHKFIVLECLSKLIHLVIDTGKTYTECQQELSIDKYRRKHNVDQVPFYDVKVEKLQTELQLLRLNYKIETDKANSLIEKETIYIKENEVHLKRIKDLNETIETLVSENDQLYNRAINDEHEIKSQGIEIDCLKNQLEQIKQELEAKSKLVEEYNSKADTYLKETESLIEEIIDKYDRDTFEESSKQQDLQNSALQSVRSDKEDSQMDTAQNDTGTSDTVDVRMTKLKNQLMSIKGLSGGKKSNMQIVKHEKDKLEMTNNEMRSKIDRLTKQLKELKEEKVIYVQVYFESRLKEYATERNFIGLLECRMRQMSIDLHAEEIKDPSFVEPETPVLIVCIKSYSYMDWAFSSASSLVESFDKSKKKALVMFHQKEKNLLISDTLQDFALKLKGIFEFGYKESHKDYDIDEGVVKRIIAFIINEGSKDGQSFNNSPNVCKNELKVHGKKT